MSVFFSPYKVAKGASTTFNLDFDDFFFEDFTGSGVFRFFIVFCYSEGNDAYDTTPGRRDCHFSELFKLFYLA